MPIHEFGPQKKIEDAEKEVEEGKAEEIRKGVPISKSTCGSGENKRLVPKETLRVQEKPKQDRIKKDEKVAEKSRETETKKTKASHPLVHGTLEIEEEEL